MQSFEQLPPVGGVLARFDQLRFVQPSFFGTGRLLPT
jgi:hypothetical protein